MDKIVVILGPTSSGKSSLAIKLARKFRGEIISADSRQVYKDMDIGTGKVTKEEQKIVPHHLLDIASPKKQYSVAEFKRDGQKKIKELVSRGKLPFIVGGTAFYIYALVDNLEIPEVKPNLKLRKQLEKKSPEQLFAMLKKSDPARARTIDKNNKVRLIRALEIIKTTGKKVPQLKPKKIYNILFLGLNPKQEILYKAIDKRIDDRLKSGMTQEVKKLLKSGVSHKKLQRFGLEYRFLSLYLQNKLDYNQMVTQLKHASHHFAKRQMTWFKRNNRIVWVAKQTIAEKEIKSFTK